MHQKSKNRRRSCDGHPNWHTVVAGHVAIIAHSSRWLPFNQANDLGLGEETATWLKTNKALTRQTLNIQKMKMKEWCPSEIQMESKYNAISMSNKIIGSQVHFWRQGKIK